MPDQLPEALVALRERSRDAARSAARDWTAPTLRGLDDAQRKGRTEAVRALSRSAGLYGLTQAPETGALALLVARETLALEGVGHWAGWFGAEAGLLAGVGEPLRSTHLLPLLAGDKRSGFAFTEPAGMPRPTWAQVEGDQLVITGRKSYVTQGAQADFLVALVDIEGQGPAMVVIDTDTPGVRIERRFESLDGSHHAAFVFEAARVPRNHAIGAPGAGRSQAIHKISAVRRAVAADCVGTIGWILDQLAQTLRKPRRDGPLAESDRIRLRFGHLRIQAYAARSTVYRTARLVDSGDPAVNESIAAKVFASEVAHEVIDNAIQLTGGAALVVGHPLEAAIRRLRASRLVEGESDVLRVNVARGFLDLDKGRL